MTSFIKLPFVLLFCCVYGLSALASSTEANQVASLLSDSVDLNSKENDIMDDMANNVNLEQSDDAYDGVITDDIDTGDDAYQFSADNDHILFGVANDDTITYHSTHVHMHDLTGNDLDERDAGGVHLTRLIQGALKLQDAARSRRRLVYDSLARKDKAEEIGNFDGEYNKFRGVARLSVYSDDDSRWKSFCTGAYVKNPKGATAGKFVMTALECFWSDKTHSFFEYVKPSSFGNFRVEFGDAALRNVQKVTASDSVVCNVADIRINHAIGFALIKLQEDSRCNPTNPFGVSYFHKHAEYILGLSRVQVNGYGKMFKLRLHAKWYEKKKLLVSESQGYQWPSVDTNARNGQLCRFGSVGGPYLKLTGDGPPLLVGVHQYDTPSRRDATNNFDLPRPILKNYGHMLLPEDDALGQMTSMMNGKGGVTPRLSKACGKQKGVDCLGKCVGFNEYLKGEERACYSTCYMAGIKGPFTPSQPTRWVPCDDGGRRYICNCPAPPLCPASLKGLSACKATTAVKRSTCCAGECTTQSPDEISKSPKLKQELCNHGYQFSRAVEDRKCDTNKKDDKKQKIGLLGKIIKKKVQGNRVICELGRAKTAAGQQELIDFYEGEYEEFEAYDQQQDDELNEELEELLQEMFMAGFDRGLQRLSPVPFFAAFAADGPSKVID